jgi:hypothetical protein
MCTVEMLAKLIWNLLLLNTGTEDEGWNETEVLRDGVRTYYYAKIYH